MEQRRSGVSCLSVPLVGATSVTESNALSAKFAELLAKENIEHTFVSFAQVDFAYTGQCRTPNACLIKVLTSDGREVEGRYP